MPFDCNLTTFWYILYTVISLLLPSYALPYFVKKYGHTFETERRNGKEQSGAHSFAESWPHIFSRSKNNGLL
jgi:hypothetical protein